LIRQTEFNSVEEGSEMTENSVQNPFTLKGKRAIITGGATGLGFAMATAMVAAGANVVVLSRHGAENLAPLGAAAVHYAFDVTDTDHTQQMIDRILDEQGPVDILVNNAGRHCKKPVEQTTVKDYTDVLNVHLVGAFALTKALVPSMKAQGHGSVLFIASMSSYMGIPLVIAYASAKAGVLGMIQTLADELGPSGIRVNGIAPGWIDTPMFRQATDGDLPRKQKILSRTPLGRFGEPVDVGNAAVFLCSEAAKFISGVCLPVDGGALIGF
jgi:gluconate 5-dehydrogenase